MPDQDGDDSDQDQDGDDDEDGEDGNDGDDNGNDDGDDEKHRFIHQSTTRLGCQEPRPPELRESPNSIKHKGNHGGKHIHICKYAMHIMHISNFFFHISLGNNGYRSGYAMRDAEGDPMDDKP